MILRPWDSSQEGHSADVLLKYLNEIGRGNGADAVERCLYADGFKPHRLKRQQLDHLPVRSLKPLEKDRSPRAPAPPQVGDVAPPKPNIKNLYRARAPAVAKQLLPAIPNSPSMQKKVKKLGSATSAPVLPPVSSLPSLVASEPKDTEVATKDELSAIAVEGYPKAVSPSKSSPSPALPPLPAARRGMKGEEIKVPEAKDARSIYAPSFKKVSSYAADKRRLRKAGGSLPAIKIKQRGTPEPPPRSWRPGGVGPSF